MLTGKKKTSPEAESKFEKIYQEYKGLMFYVANQILENESDAEDAVQNALIKISENIEKISEPVCPKTQNYIVLIVERKAIDLYRSIHRKGQTEYIEDYEGVAGIPVEGQDLSGLAACMAGLPVNYREIILLKYYHGYDCKEIAKLLNLSVANVRKLDQRAKKKLMELCKKEGLL